MSSWAILAGLLPLLLFVIVDSFCGFKKGIVVAAIAAIAEMILSLVLLKTVDALTIGSLFLVLVMGLAAWKMQSPTVFKMQPVVVGVALALALLISYAIDRPIFTLLFTKYQDQLAQINPQLSLWINDPLFIRWLDLSTLCSGIGMVIQTALVAWAAVKLNNWWWIAFRGVGLYVFLIGGAWVARFIAF